MALSGNAKFVADFKKFVDDMDALAQSIKLASQKMQQLGNAVTAAQKVSMPLIPQAITALNNGSRKDVRDVLIAAILSSEDEMLEIKESHLKAAGSYRLITTVMEDGTVVLVCEQK